MPDKPEAPALLSPERLAAITARLAGPRSASGINEALDASALLADRTAFRQAVAAELLGMLASESVLKALSAMDRAQAKVQNCVIHRAAARLHLDLTTPA